MTEKMESRNHSLLIISLSSIFFFLFISSSAEATCFPRSFNYPIPSSSVSHSSSSSSSSPSPSPPKQTPQPSPPPPQKQTPPPQTPQSSPPPPPPPPTPKSSPPPPKSSPPPPTPTPSPPPPTPTPSPSTPTLSQHVDSTISLISSAVSKPAALIPSIPSIVPGGIDAAIKDVCGKTDHVAECLSSIGPFAATGPHDPTSVFQMEIKALTQLLHKAMDTAKQLSAGPSTSTNMCAEDCAEVYEDALDDLNAAVDALAKHDFATASIQLSAAMTEFDTCEQGFMDLPGLESPLTEMNAMLEKLTSNCLAIVDLIK